MTIRVRRPCVCRCKQEADCLLCSWLPGFPSAGVTARLLRMQAGAALRNAELNFTAAASEVIKIGDT